MKTWVALAFGAILAAIVACGSAGHSRIAPMAQPGASPRQQIEQLDAQIAADLARLNVPPTIAPLSSDPIPASAHRPTSDPTCKVGASATCADSCTLADAICDNAGKICEIATSLGDDTYANTKCDSGKTSCAAARGRCCGCS